MARQISQTGNPNAALKSAISNLEQFARKSTAEPIAHVAELTVQDGQIVANPQSPLKKVIDCITGFFSKEARARHLKRKSEVLQLVLKAIDTVKRNHLIIDKYSSGSPEEKKLAISTLDAIKLYNASLEQNKSTSSDLSSKIARFLYTYSGLSIDEDLTSNKIELPQAVRISFNSTHHEEEKDVTTSSHDQPLIHEADVIRMKATTLMRQHGIRFKSTEEALTSLKAAPIHAMVNPQSQTSTVSLTLNVLPGTVIKVKGSFKRDSKALGLGAPIPDRFQLSFKFHTGFPHPSQYTGGWALDDVLIPSFPHRLDQLPLFKPLFERKKLAAVELLPDGKLLEHAQKLVILKREAFLRNRNEFIKLHRELSHSILAAASLEIGEKEKNASIIDQYYDSLEIKKDIDALNLLLEAHEAINGNFIANLHNRLQTAWIKQDSNLSSLDPTIALQAADDVLEEALAEGKNKVAEIDLSMREFVRSVGSLLGKAAKAILLQHWSETLGTAPPMLKDFECKVQAAAYAQLERFLNELENSKEVSMDDQMRDYLFMDIALFNLPTIDINSEPIALVNELEVYYNLRHSL